MPANGTGSHPANGLDRGGGFDPGGGSHPGAGSHPGTGSHPQHNPSFSHPGVGGSSIGALPNLGQPMSGSEPGHSSQPSVSNSLAISHSPHLLTGRRGESSNKKLTMVALGIAAAAGGLAALLYVGFGRGSAPAVPSAGAPQATETASAVDGRLASTAPTSERSDASTASVSAVADAKKETAIEVKVKPDAADIFLDGKKIGTGSVKTTLPIDGQEHELKVDAPGYSAKVRKIQANEATVSWEPELTGDKRLPGTVKTAAPPPDVPGEPKRDRNGKIIKNIDKTYTP